VPGVVTVPVFGLPLADFATGWFGMRDELLIAAAAVLLVLVGIAKMSTA